MADTDIDDATGEGVYRWERMCAGCGDYRYGYASSLTGAYRAADTDPYRCNHDADIIVYRDYECADECCA